MLSRQVADLAPTNVGWQCWKLFENFECNVLEKPLEAAAFVSFLERYLFTDVTNWIATYRGLTRVKVFSVFVVKPHLDHSHVVLQQIIITTLSDAAFLKKNIYHLVELKN